MLNSLQLENQEALTKMRTLGHTLRPAERAMVELILADPRKVTSLTITQLSELGNCSETTITRMSKALGYQGYGELKMAIARELPQRDASLFETLTLDNGLQGVAGRFFQGCMQSFNDTLQFLNVVDLEKIAEIISSSLRVGCFGVGASGLVANDAQQKFLRVGIPAWSFVDPHEQIVFSNGLNNTDAVICISHSGATKDVLESMYLAQKNGAKIIGIVGNPRSELAQAADLTLLALSNEAPFKSGSMITRLCQLAIVDLITLAIASNRKEDILEQFGRTQQTFYQRSMDNSKGGLE